MNAIVKNIKYLLWLILLFTGFGAIAQETISLSGTVSSAKGETLPGATVFLTNTHNATSTNIKGEFVLNNIPPGNYQLIVKMIGFETYVHNLSVPGREDKIKVRLQETSTQLRAVTIRAFDPNREKYLKIFTQNFIGESANASECKILNPGIIYFNYDKNTKTLHTFADSLLIIENKGLGYTVNYLLKSFEFNEESLAFYYAGYSYFKEMPGTDVQCQQWLKKRETAYKGSINHFMKAAFNHTAEAEGFYIFTMSDTLRYKHGTVVQAAKRYSKPMLQPLPSDSLVLSVSRSQAVLNPKYYHLNVTDTSMIYVDYRGEKTPLDFTANIFVKLPKNLTSDSDQLSGMKPLSNAIFIDKNGVTLPSNSFFISGYWTWDRLAEALPLDYVLPVNNASKFDSKLIILENQ